MTKAMATILSPGDLSAAVQALRDGDVVGMPTETVYGLAGNALDVNAVTKIFAKKERPSFDPLIVHVAPDLNSIEKLAAAGIVSIEGMSPAMIRVANALIGTFWPGPLTIILPKHKNIPDLVTSGLPRVGIRMPAHPVAQELLRRAAIPLAAPSANRFGRISPTTAQHVMTELGDRIQWIIDGGSCDVGVESTVAAVDQDLIWMLRPGKISSGDISACAGVPVQRATSEVEKASPGMLASHYAPKKPLYIIQNWSDLSLGSVLKGQTFSLLVTAGDGRSELAALSAHHLIPQAVLKLTETGSAEEAARNLFSTMRTLDESACHVILATPVSRDDGLWLAVADRLRRASTVQETESMRTNRTNKI